MKNALTLTIGFLIILTFGCSKKDPEPLSKTKTKLLTDKAWIMTSLEDKVNGMWVKDTHAPSYEADNQYVFREDGSYEVNEGATKRLPNSTQIVYTGTWKFLENETKLQFIGGDITNIVALSETAFQFTGPIGIDDERYTFAHP